MIEYNNIIIPQANPRASYLEYKDEIDKALQDVLEGGKYILGEQVEDFEKEFAAYVGVRFGIGVASGTDAIEIALRSCNIGTGDLVFTVSHTAVATVSGICRCGAQPFLVDIDPDSFLMDPYSLEKALKAITSGKLKISGRPRAVIPVHLYGQPVNMPAILDISRRYGLRVIEDCAQAHGAAINGKRVGSFGDLGAFSFYPTKNLGAFGDGGIVVTNNQELSNKLIALRQYGWVKRNISSFPGINSRLDELHAAVLRIKLKYLDKDNQQRIKIARYYSQALANAPVSLPKDGDGRSNVYHQYVIKTLDRQRFIDYLSSHSIGSAIHYPLPVHLQPAYATKSSIIVHEGLHCTEEISQQILSLPMYPQMTHSDIDRVVGALKSYKK